MDPHTSERASCLERSCGDSDSCCSGSSSGDKTTPLCEGISDCRWDSFDEEDPSEDLAASTDVPDQPNERSQNYRFKDEHLNSRGTTPQYELLQEQVLARLPEYVFPVVTEESRGSFYQEGEMTYVLSQMALEETPADSSNFADYPFETMRELLYRHVIGGRWLGREQFRSPFVSVEESFLSTLCLAERRHQGGLGPQILIIPTVEIVAPFLIFPMNTATKVWGVDKIFSRPQNNRYENGTKTEWSTWWGFAARGVEVVRYTHLSRSSLRPILNETIPFVFAGYLIGGRRNKITKDNKDDRKSLVKVPSIARRNNAHGTDQATVKVRPKMFLPELFNKLYFTRMGKINRKKPKPRDPTQSDLKRLWQVVRGYRYGHVMYMWLLSMTATRLKRDTLPEVLLECLPHAVTDYWGREPSVTSDETPRLVYYAPDSTCVRVDVKEYYDLLVACLERWCWRTYSNTPRGTIPNDARIQHDRERPCTNVQRVEEVLEGNDEQEAMDLVE